MKNTVQKTRLALATTAAFLIAGCASDSKETMPVADTDMGQCSGVNSCKGTGSCAVPGQNSCASQNSCKGKGWMPLTKSDCQERGGKFAGFKKDS